MGWSEKGLCGTKKFRHLRGGGNFLDVQGGMKIISLTLRQDRGCSILYCEKTMGTWGVSTRLIVGQKSIYHFGSVTFHD